IVYHPIGVVRSPIVEPLRPEVIRVVESDLVLEPRFSPAVSALDVGQHLLVVYHLHGCDPLDERLLQDLFTRRIPCRPNPIGVTLVRVVALREGVITVMGLDAIDGSPILDIKPYNPLFDAPPVTPEGER
ncbi:MAG: TrmO family methyltransferase, partial [Rhodothermales bacterium]